MAEMRDLSRWIRNYGHDARHLTRLIADKFVWHQLWAAMDIIDDVDSALKVYVESDFPTELGERYLRVYGALQGLFLQQDALLDLIKAIHPRKKILPNDILKDIREARNASIGHPTQLRRQGKLSAHGIVQNSMTKDGFDLLSYPEKDGKLFLHVPVLKLIDSQRTETVRILSEVVNDLRDQEEFHRQEFRDIKLVKVFDQSSYAFEKIFEESRGDALPVLGSWAFDHLAHSLDEFGRLLAERGIGIDAYDSIKYLYEEIEHPLAELGKFLRREESEIVSRKGAVVFTDALRQHFERLRNIAGEIDEEYAGQPDTIAQPERSNISITFVSNVAGN
jgi:hypothetical protein